MDPLLESLWRSAIRVAVEQRVPAPALVQAYLALVAEYGDQTHVPPEAIARVGEELVATYGPAAFLHDMHHTP
jgi:hypothetical protein